MHEDLGWRENLVRVARKAAINGDYLELAAHVYAQMKDLASQDRHGLHAASAPITFSFKNLEAHVTRVCSLPDGYRLYWELQWILNSIDESLSDPDESAIDSLDLPGHASVFPTRLGPVHIWRKRPSPLARLKWDELEKIPPGASPPIRHQEPSRDLKYLRLHLETASCQLKRVPHDEQLFSLFRDGSLTDDHLRIALCPLLGPSHPFFELTPPPMSFQVRRTEPMKDPALLRDHIGKIFHEVRRQRIHLLVFPELMVCGATLEAIEDLLSDASQSYPFAVVAGSFHEWSDASAKPHNEAKLVERNGRLLTHRKRGTFTLPGKLISKEFFPDVLDNAPTARVPEGIHLGKELYFADTRFGTIAILICADLIDSDWEYSFVGVVQSLRPDLLIVVAMSDDTSRFESKAYELSEYGIATMMVNAACVCPQAIAHEVGADALKVSEEPACLAVVHLGLYQMAAAHPVFLRWRADNRTVEQKLFGSGTKVWSRFNIANGSGVKMLNIEGKPAGMIIDYGPYESVIKLSF